MELICTIVLLSFVIIYSIIITLKTVFIDKEMETESNVEIKCSLNVLDMLPIRGQDWEAVGLNTRKLFNQTIINIQKYLSQRRISLDQFFRVFDK